MTGKLFCPEGCNLNKVGFEYVKEASLYQCGNGHMFSYKEITEDYAPGEEPIEIMDDLHLADIIGGKNE